MSPLALRTFTGAAGLALPLCIVAGWSFSEAVLWFIVADVPISWIAVRSGVRAGLLAALLAAACAMLGGAVTYFWAASDPAAFAAFLDAVPAISPEMMSEVERAWRAEGFAGMLAGSFSGTPYKLFAAAAGEQGSALLPFLLASFAARLPRFLLVAVASAAVGALLARRVDFRGRAALLLAFWVAFYAWYFSVMSG